MTNEKTPTDRQMLDWLEQNLDQPKLLTRWSRAPGATFVEIADRDDDPLAVGDTLRAALAELMPDQPMEPAQLPFTREAQADVFKAGMRLVLETKVRDAEALQASAQWLVGRATALGLVLTVEQAPLVPLAMGHHETVVSVRPARGAAQDAAQGAAQGAT